MDSSNDIPNFAPRSSIGPNPGVSEVDTQAARGAALAFNHRVADSAAFQKTDALETSEPELIRKPMLGRELRATAGQLGQYQA